MPPTTPSSAEPASAAPEGAAPGTITLAAPEPEPPYERGEHAFHHRRRPKGVREHDGFYARFALGFSGFGDTVVSGATPNNDYRDQALVTGFSTVSELAFGGTVGRGIVLGGGLYTATVETPFVFQGQGRPLPPELQRPDTFSLVGMMGDFYPNPLRGLHLQAALGLAVLSGLEPGGQFLSDRHYAFGGGAMLGIGYEWWVGEQWSVGVLGRGTVGALTEDDSLGIRWLHLAAAWPSILFTVTYH